MSSLLIGSMSAPPSSLNVKDSAYGAKGDGTTDDTAAITSAVAAAVAAGGGQVFFPAGTYATTGDLPISSHVQYLGDDFGSVIISLLAASTKNVFTSDNFASLTGGSSNAGVYHFAMRNLIIDGNKANCPSGLRGVAIYGYEYRVDDVLIRNCKTDGFYTEWGSSATPAGADAVYEESYVTNVKTFDNGGNGFWHSGPHDSVVLNLISARNGSTSANIRSEGSATNWLFCHAWGSAKYGIYTRGTGNWVMPQAEGATTACIFVEWHDAHFIGPRVFFAGGASVGGIVLGDSSHTPQRTIITDMHAYKGAGSNDFAPAIDFTHAGIQTRVSGTVDQATGSVISGTIPADADVDLRVGGGAAQTSIFQKPGLSSLISMPAIVDTFSQADASSLFAKNWTVTKGTAPAALADVNAGRARLTSGATGGFNVQDNVYVYANVTSSFADGEILLKYEFASLTSSSFFFVPQRASTQRVQGGSGYAVQISISTSGVANTSLQKYVSGANTQLQQSGNFSPALNTSYFLRFRVQGSFIAYKWWANGTPEPAAWTFSTTDTAVTAAGLAGFYQGGISAAASAISYVHEASVQAL